jgi:hypothetical protein
MNKMRVVHDGVSLDRDPEKEPQCRNVPIDDGCADAARRSCAFHARADQCLSFFLDGDDIALPVLKLHLTRNRRCISLRLAKPHRHGAGKFGSGPEGIAVPAEPLANAGRSESDEVARLGYERTYHSGKIMH